jgi:hypothetical protein
MYAAQVSEQAIFIYFFSTLAADALLAPRFFAFAETGNLSRGGVFGNTHARHAAG